MYPLHHRLCYGRTRETRSTVSYRLTVPPHPQHKTVSRVVVLTLGCRIAKDKRFVRLACIHKGTYADDCIVARVMQHRCYIVATNDQALRRRVRKTPGMPIMFVGRGKYKVEKLPTELE